MRIIIMMLLKLGYGLLCSLAETSQPYIPLITLGVVPYVLGLGAFHAARMFLTRALVSLYHFPEYCLENLYHLHTTYLDIYDALYKSYYFWLHFDYGSYIHSLIVCPQPRTFLYFWTFPQSRYCELQNYFMDVQPVVSDFDWLILLFIVAACLLYGGLTTQCTIQGLVLRLIRPYGETPELSSEVCRAAFNEQDLTKRKPVAGHSHGEAAADRSTATDFIVRLASMIGLEPYMVQCSKSDQRKGLNGCRYAFWAKDLTAQPSQFAPPDHSMLAMVDVDQYFDMPQFLCEQFGRPIILYTFQPHVTARTSNNYSFTFDKDNQVHYRVTGGGLYVHQVWNYSHDSIKVVKTFLGIPYSTAMYLIDRRPTSPDHELIYIVPILKWTGFLAPIAYYFIQGPRLERFRLVNGDFLRLRISTQDGLKVSTARVNGHAEATVPVEVDDSIEITARNSKYDLTGPQTLSWVEGDRVASAVLLDYHRARVGSKPDVVCPVDDSIRRYQFNPSTYEPANKSLMMPFMQPLLGDCFVPDRGNASEVEAVNERIKKVAPEIIQITPFLDKTMDEFISFLIPEPHKLDPTDDDEVKEKQNRPAQRKIIEDASLSTAIYQRVVQSFLKKETYGDVKAPRVISTINGVDKVEYSKFLYSFTQEILKSQRWYAFGKTPKQIAQRIADICVEAISSVCNSDFSKFDGHGSNVMRCLERKALLRAFRHTHHDKLIELHRSQYGLKGYTTEGVSYDSGYSRASGSPETAAFNGLTNSFCSYLEGRLRHMPPETAWSRLGMYGGDDGLTPDVCPDAYRRAARCIGQVVEVEVVPRGQHGVSFLARMYSPYVWQGAADSCCDLPRQLTKLHVTVALSYGITPVMKLIEKLRAYSYTDLNTPVIGPLCRRAVELNGAALERTKAADELRIWTLQYEANDQYPNEGLDWMMEYAQRVLPDLRLDAFHAWLNKCERLEDLLTPPLLREPQQPKPTNPVVVDDQVLPAGTRLPRVTRSAVPKPQKADVSRRPTKKPQTNDLPAVHKSDETKKPRFVKPKFKRPAPTIGARPKASGASAPKSKS